MWPRIAVVPRGSPCFTTTGPVALNVKSWPWIVVTPIPQVSICTARRPRGGEQWTIDDGYPFGTEAEARVSSFCQRVNNAGVNGRDG